MSSDKADTSAPLESAFARAIAPTQPSRRRLILLWAILLAWTIVLILLYFLTVRTRTHTALEQGTALAATAPDWSFVLH